MLSLTILASLVACGTSPTFYFNVGASGGSCPSSPNLSSGGVFSACGNQYNSGSKYWAAIKGSYGHCGESLIMTYQGRSITLEVRDECPGCGDGHVDMSLDALVELTGSYDAACAVNRMPVVVDWYLGGSGSNQQQPSPSAEPSPSKSPEPQWTQPSDTKPSPSPSPSESPKEQPKESPKEEKTTTTSESPSVTVFTSQTAEPTSSVEPTKSAEPTVDTGSNPRIFGSSFEVSAANPVDASIYLLSLLLL
ncbi:hypothetical protein EDD86DRAFT_207469 [Gorgonomyces haynaldii]|nr:hypothetical protein EDD86DRAFT_207469 [Gorgonomyces haynaldii]